MNTENLHELIDRYEQNYHTVNSAEHNEIFKWKAVKKFHDVWYSDTAATMTFSELFSEAKKECSILIDNSQVAPTNGIVKLAEVCPQEVVSLFRDVLFAEADDAAQVQNNMEAFLEGIEKIRAREMPQYWKYKQDRHAASCYLAFIAPEKHFIYRYSEAEEFAKYIEFGKDIGSGEDFRLEHYYEMAEIVVAALKDKRHEHLIELYHELIGGNDSYYQDESLHLMAFDLMYCCRTYNFYAGLTHALKKDSIKAYKLEQLREEERKQKEAAIAALQDEIRDLEMHIEQFAEISLIGVEVTQNQYGKGVVIKQNNNMVTIRFAEVEKTFMLGNKFPGRPHFENDEEIVDMFTEYAALATKLDAKRKELAKLSV